MDRKGNHIVFRQTGVIALGMVICVGMMLGIFSFLGKLNSQVIRGGVTGGVVAVFHFFFMAVCTSLAADKAQVQDVKGAQALLRLSYPIRTAVLSAILFACVKSGYFHFISLLLPLVFVRPIMVVGTFFRKSGEETA